MEVNLKDIMKLKTPKGYHFCTNGNPTKKAATGSTETMINPYELAYRKVIAVAQRDDDNYCKSGPCKVIMKNGRFVL